MTGQNLGLRVIGGPQVACLGGVRGEIVELVFELRRLARGPDQLPVAEDGGAETAADVEADSPADEPRIEALAGFGENRPGRRFPVAASAVVASETDSPR